MTDHTHRETWERRSYMGKLEKIQLSLYFGLYPTRTTRKIRGLAVSLSIFFMKRVDVSVVKILNE